MIQSIRHADNVKILCKIPQQIRSTVIHRMYRCAVSQMESHTILCSVIINYNRRNDWFYYSWRFNQIQWISNWPLIISIYGSTADKVFPREIKGLIKGRIKGCPSSRGISLPGRWHRASTSNSVNFQFQFAKKQKCPPYNQMVQGTRACQIADIQLRTRALPPLADLGHPGGHHLWRWFASCEGRQQTYVLMNARVGRAWDGGMLCAPGVSNAASSCEYVWRPSTN